MLNKSIEYLKQNLHGFSPDTAIVLGSGLGNLIEALENPLAFPYAEIPDFPKTTVSGHKGCLYFGNLGKHKVVCMQGRFHFYEGISQRLVLDIMELFKTLGVRQIFLTNAAGSLNESMPAGSLMLIKDHINLSGRNPLIGPHEEPYFPSLTKIYDENLRENLKQLAQRENIPLHEGVYVMTIGPNYETPAEVKMMQIIGGDAVGMSTVPETIAAAHQGVKVLGISVISNLAAGLSDHTPSHEDVLTVGEKSAALLGKLLQKFLEKY